MPSRKHNDTPRGGLILAMLLTAGMALADVWPSWLSPAQGSYDRGNQALSGAVERLTVVAGPDAWTNYVTTNIWKDYFSQWAKCKESKVILKAAIESANWYYADAAEMPTGTLITATGLLARISAPTNWFDVTPRFNLSQDTNGWVLMPAAQSNVVWLLGPGPSGAVTNGMRYYAFGESNSYDNAVIDASNNWYTSASVNVMLKSVSKVNFYAGDIYQSSLDRYVGDLYVSGFTSYNHTNREAFVDVYNYISPYDRLGGTVIYDAQGDSVPSSVGYRFLATWTNSGSLASPPFSLTLVGGSYPPMNYGVPTNTSEVVYCGWEIKPSAAYTPRPFRTIHRFNATTNGFRWFR